MEIGDWVIPKNQKVITQIEEIEVYPQNTVVYTSDRKAYSISDLMTLEKVYKLETNKK